MPDNKYFVDKYFNPHNNAEYHGTCSNEQCGEYLGRISDFGKNMTCSVCDETVKISKVSYKNFFVIIDPTVAIKNVINKYDKYYDNIVSQEASSNHVINDVYHGKMYKEFVSSLPLDQKRSYVCCFCNTDGAVPFIKSSKSSCWPIYIMINEIPISARFKNVITVGLWFGKKTNTLLYLKPFVDLFNEKLSIVGVDCNINVVEKNLKVHCIGCVVDSPARAVIQGIKQYNGTYSCNWCLIPGKILDTCRFSFTNFLILLLGITILRFWPCKT